MVSANTRGNFEAMVGSAKPVLRPVCELLRHMITGLHQDVVEVVWPRQRIASFGVGPNKMSDHYAYVAVYGSHVNLGFYHGAALKDRAGVLEGRGKRLRHVKLRDVPSVRNPAIAALLRAAITDRMRYVREGNRSHRAPRNR
jgi:hypothetical protein